MAKNLVGYDADENDGAHNSKIIDKKLLFDGKSIKQGKDRIKEKNRAKGKGKEGVF